MEKLLFFLQGNAGLTVAAEICEDLWAAAPPSVAHAMAGANVIVNLSASDETVGKADYRRELVKSQSARLLCAYIYATAGYGESTQDLVFGGQHLICENGVVLKEAEMFQNSQQRQFWISTVYQKNGEGSLPGMRKREKDISQ